jgi:hypothetical protein
MESKSYIITWYANALKIGSRIMALGICEKTGCVSHIAVYQPNKPITEQYLKTLIIHNVYADDHECEDGKFCLNVDCPLNKASLAYWRKTYGIRTAEDLKLLHTRMEEVKVELKLKVLEDHQQCCFEKAPMVIKRS